MIENSCHFNNESSFEKRITLFFHSGKIRTKNYLRI